MFYVSLLMLTCVVPIVLILFFVYKKDKEKEPLVLLLIFFFLGILASLLVSEVSKLISPFIPFMNMKVANMTFLDKLLYSFLGVALLEEVCKWAMVYFVGYHHKEFDELYDILIYAIFVSLGFAFFENVLYVIYSSSLQVAVLRAISAIPGHACDAVFMGYYLSMAKVFYLKKKKNLERNNLLLSIITPTLLHGIYDFCLLLISTLYDGKDQFIVSSICIFIFSLFICTLYFYSYRRVEELSDMNSKMK